MAGASIEPLEYKLVLHEFDRTVMSYGKLRKRRGFPSYAGAGPWESTPLLLLDPCLRRQPMSPCSELLLFSLSFSFVITILSMT